MTKEGLVEILRSLPQGCIEVISGVLLIILVFALIKGMLNVVKIIVTIFLIAALLNILKPSMLKILDDFSTRKEVALTVEEFDVPRGTFFNQCSLLQAQ